LDKLENDINYGALADCDKDGLDNRIDADQCPTFAPNGISPNSDGKNDVLIIPGILRNQPNELTIFNRWGNIVYQTSNYKNDWGGQTDRAFSLLAGDNLLPDGTYYYVIDFFGKYPNVVPMCTSTGRRNREKRTTKRSKKKHTYESKRKERQIANR
jgi:gliding motility-associated-like protein